MGLAAVGVGAGLGFGGGLGLGLVGGEGAGVPGDEAGGGGGVDDGGQDGGDPDGGDLGRAVLGVPMGGGFVVAFGGAGLWGAVGEDEPSGEDG